MCTRSSSSSNNEGWTLKSSSWTLSKKITSPYFTKESSLIRGVCQISQISLECRGNHILYWFVYHGIKAVHFCSLDFRTLCDHCRVLLMVVCMWLCQTFKLLFLHQFCMYWLWIKTLSSYVCNIGACPRGARDQYKLHRVGGGGSLESLLEFLEVKIFN